MLRRQISIYSIFVRFLPMILLVTTVACSAVKSSPLSQDAEGDGDGSSPEESASPQIFPHPDQWEIAASHGIWVLQNGFSGCLICHKQSSAQVENPPTCGSCHPLYPHSEDWVNKEVHGVAVLQVGTSSCTTQCHGFDLQGGLSGISCTACHTIYPHVPDWTLPTQHGEAAEGNGVNLCKGCHGDDLEGGDSDVSCTLCHSNYPHAADWSDPENHGSDVITNGVFGCATQCHGTDLQGGLSDTSCNSCHNLYPHASSWESDHQTIAPQLGLDVCQDCHGSDFATVLDGQNCFSCHADYPHPASAVWLPYTGGHGERVQVTYSQSTSACQGCHGSDLQTLKDGQNCFSCHASYPHADTEAVLWEDYGGHGQYALANSTEGCKTCHGSDFTGGPRDNPSCFSCHTNYPHGDDWASASEHGPAAYNDGKQTCDSANCHGVNFEGNPPIAPACVDCHEDFPHTDAGWVNGFDSVHVTSFTQKIADGDTEACQECHGESYDRELDGGSCITCHPDGITHTSTWSIGSGHGLYYSSRYTSLSDDAQCTNCHGGAVDFYDTTVTNGDCMNCHQNLFGEDIETDQTLEVLAAQSDCYTCHWAYPHTSYNFTNDGGDIVSGWGPTTNDGGFPFHAAESYGHLLYIMRSPYFLESDGDRPGMPNVDATENTCGDSAGSCHFGGLRSVTDRADGCGDYCHSP